MKETDKGYVEWLELRREIETIKTDRMLSAFIGGPVVFMLVIAAFGQADRNRAARQEIRKLTERVHVGENSPHLTNWYQLRDRLNVLERDWKLHKEVCVERKRCAISGDPLDRCGGCALVYNPQEMGVEYRHFESTEESGSLYGTTINLTAPIGQIETIQLGTGLVSISESAGTATVNVTARLE